MKDRLTKSDVMWGYVSKGISMSSGLITLPLILHFLSQDEIALNYLFISIISLASLFDLGFSSQFSRNFAFVFGGGQDIVEIGVTRNVKDDVNYRTLFVLVKSAKWIYAILASIMALVLLTGGTIYIYRFTDGFSLIEDSLPLWLLFSTSIVFDFYYKYYTPLLMGENLIKEVNQIAVFATSSKLIIITLVILIGGRLWAVVLGNIASIITTIVLSTRCFYTDFIKHKFAQISVDFKEIKEATKKLWYNAKRLAVVRLSTYLATQLIVLLSGIYLSKEEVSSLGLLVQMVGIISTVSLIINNSYIPLYSALRVCNNKKEIYNDFTLSVGCFFFTSLLGYIFIIIILPYLLIIIKSNAHLPQLSIVLIYIIYKFLEDQHCICSIYLTTGNVIVDRHSAPIIGFVVAIGLYFVLHYTSWGLFGMVLVQLSIPLCYPNWKWPWEVCKEFEVSYFTLMKDSVSSVINKAKNIKFI